jgi:hypothetical protein
MSSPYRLASSSSYARRRASAPTDREVTLVFGLLWLVSLVRVIGAVVRHEVFAAEATLALLAVVGLPWVVFGSPGRAAAGRAKEPRAEESCGETTRPS